MIVFPNAKINLGLNVLARRQDGYHDIESVMVPIPVHDVLEAVIDPGLAPDTLVYTRTGLAIPGAVETDLCYKAVRRIQKEHRLPGLRLHLHKVIPMGAGLGGGSSDGAHALMMVNTLCALGLTPQQLANLALELGSDCPFFVLDRPCAVRGRGEQLTPIDLDLRGIWMVLTNPGIHVGTAEVYRNTPPTGVSWDLEDSARREHMHQWSATLPNTMEPYVLRTHPVVADLKQTLVEQGAFYAAMSGSGSSVFGLFEEEPTEAVLPNSTSMWKIRFAT